MPLKILQVLHLCLAELEPGREQECLAQLSTSQLGPVTHWVLRWHHCPFHLAVVDTTLLPGHLSTSQVGDAAPARLTP